nr:MAG TPA: hypothetical protein [Caudoviricetes sp.]
MDLDTNAHYIIHYLGHILDSVYISQIFLLFPLVS